MKKKNGFIISTTLYGIFGIMCITIFYILYILSTNRVVVNTGTTQAKKEIEAYEYKKVYLNFLGSDSELNNISDTNINTLKSDLKKNGIILVTDKSPATFETTGIKRNRQQNIIAQLLHSEHEVSDDTSGCDDPLSDTPSTNYEVLPNGMLMVTTNNTNGKNFIIYDYNNNSTTTISTSFAYTYDLVKKYDEDTNNLCIQMRKSSTYKNITINLENLTYTEASGKCTTGVTLDDDADSLKAIAEKSGIKMNEFYFTGLPGIHGLYLKILEDGSKEVTFKNTTKVIDDFPDSFDVEFCHSSSNNATPKHACIGPGTNYKLYIESGLQYERYPSCTYTRNCPTTLPHSKSFNIETHPKALVEFNAFAYNRSVEKRMNDLDECEDGNDICINSIPDFNNIGDSKTPIFHDTGLDYRGNSTNITGTVYDYSHTIKYNNKIGILFTLRADDYNMINSESNRCVVWRDLEYYILWYDEYDEREFKKTNYKKIFNINTTNKDLENLSSYDSEYYVFTTDEYKDSSNTSRLYLSDDLYQRINSNSNINKLVFSTDENVKATIPVSYNKFYNSSIDLNTIKNEIIAEFSN